MDLLKQLYQIHSLSGFEKRMGKFIKRWIRKNIPYAFCQTDKLGNIYVTRGKAKDYPCLASHIDQVQKIHSEDFVCIDSKDIILGYSPRNRRQEGLGADDKNGIWIALKCLKEYECLKAVFFVGEEKGCLGSSAADLTFFEDCRFVVQSDRRGYKDLVTNIGWNELCSREFLADTEYEKFGYQPHDGMITDVGELKERGLAISCINLSCGYYEPHSDEEFTVKKDLLNCLALVRHIIENCTKIYPHIDNSDCFDDEREYMHWEQYDEMSIIIDDILAKYPNVTAECLKEYYGIHYDMLTLEEFRQLLNEAKENIVEPGVLEEPIPFI